MKKTIIGMLMGGLLAASCADQFQVSGSSTVQNLEGRTLYLKVYQDDDMKTLDSAKVVHGRFTFKGVMDSTMMANVFLDDESVMPLVLEDGEVTLKLADNVQSATGTPLNDSLHAFIVRKNQIDAQLAELPHKESQMIMDGLDHQVILTQLNEEYRKLSAQDDQLTTHFIMSNYNNVLGPGIFMIMTSGLKYPVLNPQIDEIVSQATPYFLGHPYVKEYLKAANENMEKIRGGN